MHDKKTNSKFEYSYSAPTEEERREIEDIRKYYDPAPQPESKMETLRKLNRKVTVPPKIVTSVLSIFGILLFGTGLTLILEWMLYIWGIAVSALGAAVLCAVYPVQKAYLKRNRKKYEQRIIELSDELLNKKSTE